ncbi:MAG TPA: TRAP transporter small permease subunit [Ideonella sp.]|uniref:TRAP transporter small permease subunit n=1 Tax=Ideonella sp. TaxID=1929293 RepID=UPI002E2F9E7D|nr:TRAP transporter small permease subunit [Ideonella sp.]HEX5683833.1 TRAP transporter small permease subunit [Ideonella sp.]
MAPLLRLSAWIDSLNEAVGKFIRWLVLAAVLISAGNAIVRKLFNYSSNSFLEIQWYLFAGVFMLGVGYVFLHNGHVRIDFISARLSARTNAAIDSIGIVVFTIPLAIIMMSLGWPLFHNAWVSGEMSQNAGGLIRWPVLALIPLGFLILLVQSLSELIKRVAFLTGHRDQPFTDVHAKSAEEELAEELAASAAKLRESR